MPNKFIVVFSRAGVILQGMKTLFAAACFCVMASSMFGAPFSELDFKAATKEAAKTGKIVLVDFYTTWCGPCKLLDKNTWTDAAVIQLLEQKTVALRIDAEKEVALSKRYKIAAYPSVLLIKPDGTEIDRLVGYRDPKVFLADFNDSLAGKDAVGRAREKLAAAGNNDPSARMQVGVALAQKGKDAEALEEYLWCFDHGLEAGPAFTGVRVSFLLSYIKQLADHYPPAGKALEARRDAAQAKVTAGATDYQTVQDLVTLNNALGQKEKNFTVFDQLPAGNKGKDVILRLYADQFLQAKRYSDVLEGTDGISPFKKSVDRFDQMLNPIGKDNPMRERMEETMRQLTVNAGAQYFEALAGLKRNEEGRELARQILKFDSSPATRTVLVEAAVRAGDADLAKSIK
jgi:thiol-disulfide isomerase/thioredoxin